MYIMLTGQPPFFNEDNFELFELIKAGVYDTSSDLWNGISESGKDLISRLLVVDPAARLKAEEVMNHPWLTADLS
jgi:serine/threonine protein kinase